MSNVEQMQKMKSQPGFIELWIRVAEVRRTP